MKPRKSTVLVVLLTFLLAAFAIAMAQGTQGGTQTDKKKAESCCVEGAKCCKEGAECSKEHADKEHADCCGESCEMKDKHDATGKHDPKKHADCCKAKSKDGKTKTKTE
jgi:hypothetical protein